MTSFRNMSLIDSDATIFNSVILDRATWRGGIYVSYTSDTIGGDFQALKSLLGASTEYAMTGQ